MYKRFHLARTHYLLDEIMFALQPERLSTHTHTRTSIRPTSITSRNAATYDYK